ncbi:MAG: SDR family oxidoreductase [Myxococcales bacterium]|nr:SDR family oxidoreductase [Myxococcales bacterium]
MSAHGQWAVVLGASAGVGARIAEALAADPGLNVFAIHRGNWPEGAAQVRRAVNALGREYVEWRADGGTADAPAEGVGRMQAALGADGKVAVLVHSLASASVGALVCGDPPLHPKQYAATFARMAHSFPWWVQALHAAELLAPQGARLLALGNIMPDVVVRQTPLIAASKAALHQYVRHLAFELGPQGHRVNLVDFSFVPTPAAEATFGPERLARLTAVMRRGTPADRLMDPAALGRLVSTLVGPAGEWFNGARIDFTGGESQSFFDALLSPERLR